MVSTAAVLSCSIVLLLYLTNFQRNGKPCSCSQRFDHRPPLKARHRSPWKYAAISDTLASNCRWTLQKSNCYSQPQTVFCRLSDVSSEANMYALHTHTLVWAAATEALRHGLSITEWIKDNEHRADSLMGPLGIHKSPTWQHGPARIDCSRPANLWSQRRQLNPTVKWSLLSWDQLIFRFSRP